MAKEFLGIGWKFPVTVDIEGKISMSEYETDIKEAILIILGTRKGERIMHPDFGCGIHDFVFSPLNKTTISLVENAVREALTLWEPRIELIKVEVVSGDSKEKTGNVMRKASEEPSTVEASIEENLLVKVTYCVRNTNNRFNLVYPFYLKEG